VSNGSFAPSFSSDAVVVIAGWPLSATDRTSSPYVDTIASLTHRTNVGLYGPNDALTPGDWLGTDGVTNADVNGEFTVSDAGTLYIDLPSNYESRLDVIPDQNFPTGMPGAPGMYWYHRADVWAEYDGQPDQSGGTWSEPPEAVYCGRGFPCLKLTFPTAAADDELTVTLAVRTYTHSDNHLSDSTRQTTYSYSVSEATYTYSCQLSDGTGYVYLAVPAETFDPDLEVVTRLTISGFSNGNWRIGEPEWCEDPNEDITHHHAVKFFENWRYQDGGFSGVADSVCRAALMDTTEGNAGHDNTVETRTVRIFDYVEGAASGLDLSTAKSLQAMMATVTNVCDAWIGSYDSEAADAATIDANENVLKTLSATDIRPVVNETDTGLDVAIRVAQWSTVGGLKYDWTAEKIVGGAIHGPMTSGGTLLRSATGQQVWRRPQGGDAWSAFDTPDSNPAGYWVSDSGEVYATYDPEAVLYEYGLGSSAGAVSSTGRLAAREYDIAELLAISRHDIWMIPPGIIYQLRSVGRALKIYWLPFPHSSTWRGGTTLATANEGPEDLCLRGLYTQPALQCAWREGTTLKLAVTPDGGDTCIGPYSSALGYTVMRHEVVWRRWYTAGLKDGRWCIRYRDPTVFPIMWLPFSDGSTEATIAVRSDTEMFLASDHQGLLYAVFDGAVYVSMDSGETWLKRGTFEATGWSQLCGWVLGHRMMVMGYSGGWRTKLFAILGGSPLEIVGSDGEVTHTIAGAGEGYLQEEVGADFLPIVVNSEDGGMNTYYSLTSGETWVGLI